MKERIAVIGLGYVGLPVALAFARKLPGTIGFDIDARRVADLRRGHDWTGETGAEELTGSALKLTSEAADLKGVTFFIVCVPTPIDNEKRPDLKPLVSASRTVGGALSKGAVVVYESTVYPGATEEVCGPVLEQVSGLTCGTDFNLGYSPERINPGDREHTLERITKVVSGEDAETLDRVAEVYGAIIEAGVHRAPTIKAAEAAKVIENTQRDLNIALMNELALIFEKMGIRTRDVLEAAGTKWNFLKFNPGLVGGHCIGVDPYYLTSKAEAMGYRPEVILAGRRINDNMGAFIAGKLVRMSAGCDVAPSQMRIGILGLAFKEDVRDLRNSRIPDIVAELKAFGIKPIVCDPLADQEQAHEEYGITLSPMSALEDLHGLVLAVPHREVVSDSAKIFAMLRQGGALIDVKSALDPRAVPGHISFWSL
jgi:UDP-N-acetyl-D-galactosamine dehydrogenase